MAQDASYIHMVMANRDAVFNQEDSDVKKARSETIGNNLIGIQYCYSSGALSRKGIYSIDYDRNGYAIAYGTECYAVLWNMLHEAEDGYFLKYGSKIHAYRFRLVDVSDAIGKGSVYEGRIRIGTDRTPNSQCVRSDKLGVVLYNKDMDVLAKISARDWQCSAIHKHIGDVADNAILFCDGHKYNFLYMVVAWKSELYPYEYRGHGISRFRYFNHFIEATSPEALSDLTVGELFNANPIESSGGVGITRIGRNYAFALLPSELGEAIAHLAATGCPEVTFHCVNHGWVRRWDRWAIMVEIMEVREEKIEELARFRSDSGLDVRFDDDYETIYLPKIESPYDIPFGSVDVGCVEIPRPGRKNPIVELRVNDVVVDSARYHDGQRMINGGGSKYEILRKRVSMKPLWAKLHYNERDEPYLNIIWTCGTDDRKEAEE